jgi:SAM-dependent methyltransferase
MTLNQPREVREQYADSSNLAARADLHARYSTNRCRWPQWAYDRLQLSEGSTVLEVGCGPGWLWRSNLDRLAGRIKIVASDMSPGMVGEARSALGDRDFAFAVADAQAMPFAAESFDVVVANHMLYHVTDLDLALREFARVLVAGGRLCAATNGRRHLREINGLIDAAGVSRPGWAYVRAFGLETGPEAVARHFDDVAIERHEDALEVTEAEPVIDYIRSMGSFWRVGSDDALETMRGRVQDAIDRDGAFRVQKDAGLISARKPG